MTKSTASALHLHSQAQIEAIQEKQDQVMRALVGSGWNSYGLNLSMIRMVCESSVPTVRSSRSHWDYWTRMANASEAELLQDLGKQIQNRRILSEVLGDGDDD